jgi:hypothetical protein
MDKRFGCPPCTEDEIGGAARFSSVLAGIWLKNHWRPTGRACAASFVNSARTHVPDARRWGIGTLAALYFAKGQKEQSYRVPSRPCRLGASRRYIVIWRRLLNPATTAIRRAARGCQVNWFHGENKKILEKDGNGNDVERPERSLIAAQAVHWFPW